MPGSVAVVGLGRVGLPLALSFADRGLDVIGVEREEPVLERSQPGGCPSTRPAPRSCSSACALRPAAAHRSVGQRPRAPTTSCSRSARPPTCTSRSTCRRSATCSTTCFPCCARATRWCCARRVAPGTTEWVAGYIEQRRGFSAGETLFVAHVPERIAENRFLEEIATLPCIVGGVGEGSGARAAELF